MSCTPSLTDYALVGEGNVNDTITTTTRPSQANSMIVAQTWVRYMIMNARIGAIQYQTQDGQTCLLSKKTD